MNTTHSTFSKDFNLGMRSYMKSFGFIMKHRMGYFYLYPLAFIVLFSVGALYSIDLIVDSITPWVNSTFGLMGLLILLALLWQQVSIKINGYTLL